ncbi:MULTISPECIES: polyphenol oxidase family protein [unclassified Ornithinimicrobium]|uniref:polyphenol oxidase family protein n=1 Tax=unclassified Ornithinimicrobium TaxID=2615080 RepID=UPI003853C37E
MFRWREDIEPSGAFYGVEWVFTDRRGGSSQPPHDEFNLASHVGDRREAVEMNRHRLAHELGLRLVDLRFMDQVHGCDVAVTTDPTGLESEHTDRSPSVDGLISGRTDEALVVLVADCTPVLLLDRTEGLVAVVHAGRPGMVGGLVPAVIARMHELGARNLEAVVGPSVCPRCYEVPEEMRSQAMEVEPTSGAVSWTGTPAVDVAGGVVAQLAREGVALRWLPGCTREDPDLYSYRRDGTTGRFAGVVRLLPPEQVA